MEYRAKIFQNGGSQAVQLPQEYRFEGEEVMVHREGNQIILEPAETTSEPVDEWPQSFLDTLGAWDEEIERPHLEP